MYSDSSTKHVININLVIVYQEKSGEIELKGDIYNENWGHYNRLFFMYISIQYIEFILTVRHG